MPSIRKLLSILASLCLSVVKWSATVSTALKEEWTEV